MNEDYIRALSTLTKASSDSTLDAVIAHICDGLPQKKAGQKFGVKQSAVGRLTTRLKELDEKLPEILALRT